MPANAIPILLIVLSLTGVGLVGVALGIYLRLGRLVRVLAELHQLVAGSQAEMVQAKEGIGRVHVDLGRLVANTNMTSELVRSVSKLPTR